MQLGAKETYIGTLFETEEKVERFSQSVLECFHYIVADNPEVRVRDSSMSMSLVCPRNPEVPCLYLYLSLYPLLPLPLTFLPSLHSRRSQVVPCAHHTDIGLVTVIPTCRGYCS